MTKKRKLPVSDAYEVLVESFDYTIVSFEPMMSVYFRPKTREREEGKRVFIFVSNAHFCG